MEQKTSKWIDSGSGYFIRDVSGRDVAVRIASATGTSSSEREAYAEQVNADAQDAFSQLASAGRKR